MTADVDTRTRGITPALILIGIGILALTNYLWPGIFFVIGGALVIGGDMSMYVVVPIICEQCGYTHLFSATRSGLLKASVDWPRLPSP